MLYTDLPQYTLWRLIDHLKPTGGERWMSFRAAVGLSRVGAE